MKVPYYNKGVYAKTDDEEIEEMEKEMERELTPDEKLEIKAEIAEFEREYGAVTN